MDTANMQPTLSSFWVSSSAHSRPAFSLDEIRQILPADLSSWRSGKLVDALRRKVADIARMEKQLARSKKQLCALKIEGKPNGTLQLLRTAH
jgi:hypothetical protein